MATETTKPEHFFCKTSTGSKVHVADLGSSQTWCGHWLGLHSKNFSVGDMTIDNARKFKSALCGNCVNADRMIAKLESDVEDHEILKPCPFCGGEAIHELSICMDDSGSCVYCTKCKAKISVLTAYDTDPVEQWNSRTTSEAMNLVGLRVVGKSGRWAWDDTVWDPSDMDEVVKDIAALDVEYPNDAPHYIREIYDRPARLALLVNAFTALADDDEEGKQNATATN